MDSDLVIYLASPKAKSLAELREKDLFLSDIALHDATRQLILLNEQRRVEVELR